MLQPRASRRAQSQRWDSEIVHSSWAMPVPDSHRLRLLLARPVGAYLARTPFSRGRGFLIRNVLEPLLPPPPASFTTAIPGGAVVRLQYREVLGRATFIRESFEAAELKVVCSLLREGDFVVDVGANIGYYTVAMAKIVGSSGQVLAIEPEPDNVRRLEENIDLNNLANIRVCAAAASNNDGNILLHIADDPGYHSTALRHERLPVTILRDTRQSIVVRAARIDTLWRNAGSPPVAFMKIDVEGDESQVLEGARDLIQTHGPPLLIEVDQTRLDHVHNSLTSYGYARSQPENFQESNHFFHRRPEC
jgi:FkbM family methyltransferase